jgi:isochorismate synthase
MSEIIAKAKRYFADNKPFVMYCKPNSDTLIGLFQEDDKLYSLSNERSGFAFVSFDFQKKYMIPDAHASVYFEKLGASDYYFSENNVAAESDSEAKINFTELVKLALKAIDNQVFDKVVLSREEIQLVSHFDIELVFNRLLLCYPAAFRYVFYHPKIGFWMGATPEQLVKVDDGVLSTVSLAGTQLHCDKDQIVWTEKEIMEQQIVTDFIVATLKMNADEVTFSDPYTVLAGNLAHIKTDITAKIDPDFVENSLSFLHPTPAVCGFPKEAAKQFIVENEGYNREFYAGFLGEWQKNLKTYQLNYFDLFVNLRCLKYDTNKLHFYVGCGITKDSNPEKEFEETVNKSMTMKKIV